jgi:uncharacterized membrane protein
VDVLEQIAGALFVTTGLWLIFPPVAIIALGVMIGLHGVLLEMKNMNEKEGIDGSREPTALDNSTRYP